MWVAEVIGSSGAVESKTFLKGPICKIGRREDNCLSFPTDKSISRVHAEIHIDGSKAFLKDLGSKFGTFYVDSDNNSKLAVSGSSTNLTSGQIVTFGPLASTVRFVKEHVNFCITRLDSKEKERVQKAADIIGGKVSQSPESATHIVTNSISGATSKMLAAIVFKKKIVTTGWLEFTESTGPSARIRPIEDFFPPLELTSVRLIDSSASRSNLLRKFNIISVNSTDMQYASLMKGCGAAFITACDRSQDEIKTILKSVPLAESDIICTFCDDFFSRDNSCVLAMQLIQPGMKYLSATQLATAIFNNVSPSPVAEPPMNKVSSSQRQTQASQSQVLNRASKTNIKKEKSSSSSSSSMAPPMPRQDGIKNEQRTPPRKKICTETAPEVPIVLSFAPTSSPIPTMKRGKSVDEDLSSIHKSTDLPAVDQITETQTQHIPRQMDIVVQQDRQRKAQPEIQEIHQEAHQELQQELQGAVREEMQQELPEEISGGFDDTVGDSTPVGPQSSSSRSSTVSDSDWIDAVGGSDREEMLRCKRKTYKSEFENSAVDQGSDQALTTRSEAECVLRDLIVQRAYRPQAAPRGKRDMRCFRKNRIRVVEPGNVLSAVYMESVLPKETEREIQLRLEADMEDSREEFAEQMFADRFQQGKAAPNKRSLKMFC